MRGLDLQAASRLLDGIGRLGRTLIGLIVTATQYAVSRRRLSGAFAVENFFLRKHLVLFQEREIKPRRADDATRPADAAYFTSDAGAEERQGQHKSRPRYRFLAI